MAAKKPWWEDDDKDPDDNEPNPFLPEGLRKKEVDEDNPFKPRKEWWCDFR